MFILLVAKMMIVIFMFFPKVPVVVAVIFALVIVFIMGLTLYQDPKSSGAGLGLTLLGVPLYIIFVRWRKPVWFENTLGKKLSLVSTYLIFNFIVCPLTVRNYVHINLRKVAVNKNFYRKNCKKNGRQKKKAIFIKSSY